MRIVKISILSLVVAGLSACSSIGGYGGYLKDETQTYRKAEPVERTVVIPQNLNSKNVQDYYEVPEASPDAV